MTESNESDSVKGEDILKLIESVEFGRVIVVREGGKTVLVEDDHTRKPKDFEGIGLWKPSELPLHPPVGPDRIIRKGI